MYHSAESSPVLYCSFLFISSFAVILFTKREFIRLLQRNQPSSGFGVCESTPNTSQVFLKFLNSLHTFIEIQNDVYLRACSGFPMPDAARRANNRRNKICYSG